VKGFWFVTIAALVVIVIADLLLGVQPPGLVAVFSFAGCAVIIVGSKWLGKRFIQRPEDYYRTQTTLPEDVVSGAHREERGVDRG
jgi:hypothetical protein